MISAWRVEVGLIAVLCFCAITARGSGFAHTPEPGSPERQAICDAARAFVLSKYVTRTLPQPIVFKIEHLAVQGSYCNLEAIPLFKDGTYIGSDYMVDIAFNLCLRKTDADWHVIADLSRTDVPAAAEVSTIRRSLPPDFPLSVLSPTWRDLFRGSLDGREPTSVPPDRKSAAPNAAPQWTDLVNPSQKLVGTWQGVRHRKQYFADGTFVTDPHLVPNPPRAQWRIEGDRLIEYLPEAGVTITSRIVSITNRELVTTDDQGHTYREKRIPDKQALQEKANW